MTIVSAKCPRCGTMIIRWYGSVGVCDCGQATLFQLLTNYPCSCGYCNYLYLKRKNKS